MDPSTGSSPPQNMISSSGSRSNLAQRPASRRESAEQAHNTGSAPIPDEEHGADLPLTMSASVVLSSLPRDAHKALADVEAIDMGKGKDMHPIHPLSHLQTLFL